MNPKGIYRFWIWGGGATTNSKEFFFPFVRLSKVKNIDAWHKFCLLLFSPTLAFSFVYFRWQYVRYRSPATIGSQRSVTPPLPPIVILFAHHLHLTLINLVTFWFNGWREKNLYTKNIYYKKGKSPQFAHFTVLYRRLTHQLNTNV